MFPPARKLRRQSWRTQFESLEPRQLLAADPVITEFMAINDRTLADGDGDFSDWIEVQNWGDMSIDLAGAHLTDDPDDPSRWPFPSVTLDPGDYLTVFASGKGVTGPVGEFHTNFQLNGDGEYLALVLADGTIATQYAPYPPQVADQSYGQSIGRETTIVLGEADLARTLVPEDNSLGQTWTESGFDDNAWQSGTSAVGYERLEGGFSILDNFDAPLGDEWTVDIPDGGSSTVDVSEGNLTMDIPSAQNSVGERGLAPVVIRDLPVAANAPFHLTTRVDAVSGAGGAGIVVFDTAVGKPAVSVQFSRLTTTIGQAQLTIDGVLVKSVLQLGAATVSLRLSRDPVAGTWTGFFRASDGDEWKVIETATDGSDVAPVLQPQVGLIGRTSNSSLTANFEFFEISAEDEQPLYGPRTGLDVEGAMFGNNASVFTRFPFQATNVADVGELVLGMQYDDGFVAYLNGAEVARRNAPGNENQPLDFDAAATEERADGLAVRYERINISQHLASLREGDNILAIQALNVEADDSDLFVRPRVESVRLGTIDTGPLSAPSPGAQNPPVVSDPPLFSQVGGTFTATVTLEFTHPSPVAEIRFTLNGAIPNENSTLYSDALVLNETTQVRAIALEPGRTPSQIVGEAYLRMAEDVQAFNSNLPILILENFGGSVPNTNAMSDFHLTVFDVANEGTSSPGNTPEINTRLGLKVRGSSSAGFPKKQYRVETRDQYDADLDLSILGLPAESDWVLGAPYTDKTLIRNTFAFELGREIGLEAPNSRHVEVFLNQNGGDLTMADYVGVYFVSDSINRGPDRVDVPTLQPSDTTEPDISGGYIIRFEGGVANGPDTLNGWNSLEMVQPEEYTVEQKAWISDYVNAFDAVLSAPNFADPDTGYASFIDVDSFINLMVINELTRDQDSYVRSNYLYKDREGKLTQGPLWDYNLIMGTGCCFDNRNPQGWQYQHPYNRGLEQNRGDNPDWIVKLMQDPNYAQRFEDRWFELRQGPLSLDGLFARIDAQTIPLTEAAERNFDKWNILGNGNPGFPSPVTNTWQEQIDFIKNWLTQRVAWIDSQLLDPPAPEYSVPGGLVAEGTQVSVTADAAQITTDTVVVAEGDSAAWFVPTDNTLGLTWTEAAFDDATWSTGPTGIGYETAAADYAALIQTRVRPQETCAACTTVMARTEFTVDDLANVDQINLRMKYDDGFVAYINGQEVARKNVTGTPNFNSSASDHPDGSAVVFEDSLISVEPGLLNAGSDNVLAIQVVNSGTGSSDQLLIAEFVLQQIESVGSAPIYLTLDGSDPRGTDGQPTAPLYDGTPLTVNEDSLVQARSLVNGQWSALSVAQYTVGVIPIVITELNYNPHPPSDAELTALPGIDNDDLEFIEVQNVGDRPTNLANLAFVDGVDFTFPFYQLAPGERALIVKNQAAFELRYGTGLPVVGEFNGGRLSNAGETITLVDPNQDVLSTFDYDDSFAWPQTADGRGGTLEFRNVLASNELYSKYYSWRGSADFGGSPGAAGSDPIGVVINEVLAHTDPPLMASDSIELLNTTSAAVDISGWYLSDAGGNLLKYRIPAGTLLGAGETIVFDESQFNPTPPTPGDNDFALSGANGDEVYLVISNGNGGVQTLVDDVHFGASLNGVSFGRVPDGTGLLTPLGRTSLGCGNGAHRAGELVISEVNYNPELPNDAAIAADPNITSGDLEFIEIHNPSGNEIDLTDWRIRGGVDLNFDDDMMIAAGETVLLIPFNPDSIANESRVAAFNAHYGINGVRLIGGYDGQLSGNGERVQLQRPDEPPQDAPTNIPHVSEDQILYDSLAPWSSTANGLGDSLQRNSPTFYGNSVTSWSAAVPTPGTVSFIGGVAGDLNGDGTVNALDIDMLNGAVNAGQFLVAYDLDGSGSVNADDTIFLVESILGTFMGDTNLDGRVDSIDLNQIGIHWQQTGGCLTWAKGNFDGDNDVDVTDLNFVGINWQSAAAARARVPRAPLASHAIVVATTDAAMAEADDETKTAGNVQAVDSEQVERSTRRVLHRLARREVRRLDTLATHNLAQQETGYTENIDELLANWRK